MKLFSRKALVAVAATTALTVSGMTAPAFAQQGTTETGFSSTLFSGSSNEEKKPADASDEGEPDVSGLSSDYKLDKNGDPVKKTSEDKASELRTWIGVFTAIIGALSTVFTFVQKIN